MGRGVVQLHSLGTLQRSGPITVGQIRQHFGHRPIALFRIFGQSLEHDLSEGCGQCRNIRRRRQMLHDNLLRGLAVEWQTSGQELVQHDAHRVDIDLATVDPASDLGGHVVNGAHAFGMSAAPRTRNKLAQAVVADFDQIGFRIMKNVTGLQVAMHNPVLVQIMDPGRNAGEPPSGVGSLHPLRMVTDHILETRSGHKFHHDPALAVIVQLDIPQVDQVGVFQIEALPDATQLDFQIPSNSLDGHLFSRVTDGKIDFAEAPDAEAPFDGVPRQGGRAARECKPHSASSLGCSNRFF
jgi:hypothetical protein